MQLPIWDERRNFHLNEARIILMLSAVKWTGVSLFKFGGISAPNSNSIAMSM